MAQNTPPANEDYFIDDYQYATKDCNTHNKKAIKSIYQEIGKNGNHYLTYLLRLNKSDYFSNLILEIEGGDYIDNKFLLPFASNYDPGWSVSAGQIYCFNVYVAFKEILISLLLILYCGGNKKTLLQYRELILIDDPTTQKK